MRKIISLFARNYDGDRLVRDELVPGAEWVVAGKGIATRKYDGTCCLVRDGQLFKRYEVAKGKQPPANFEPADSIDPITGKQQGWLVVSDGPEDRWHREGLESTREVYDSGVVPDGTYELIGPKVQGNPEHAPRHVLIPHGCVHLDDCPRDFGGIKAYLAGQDIEGIVWWRELGNPKSELVKIKSKDFGIKRGRS